MGGAESGREFGAPLLGFGVAALAGLGGNPGGVESDEVFGAGVLAAGAAAGGRARTAINRTDSLARVLQGKTMTVGQAMEAVQKTGYRANSKSFRIQVTIALIKGPFKRVGRGEYTAK